MEDTSAAECPRAFPLPQVAGFRFFLQALEPPRLPPYAGSIWRGLLGLGLRRAACVTRQPSCEGCLLLHACVYSMLFESPATLDPLFRTPERHDEDGRVGELRLRGPGLATFYAALRRGQSVHLGKDARFGLGAYRLERAGSGAVAQFGLALTHPGAPVRLQGLHLGTCAPPALR